MDGPRLDKFAKHCAMGLPRRAVLRALGATVAGLLGAGRPGPEGASAQRQCSGTGGTCGPDRDCCQPAICTAGHCCPAGRVFCKGRCIRGCPPAGQCQDAGVLDPDTCRCTYPPKPNGAPCDDGDPCTVGDSCQDGFCTGAPTGCSA